MAAAMQGVLFNQKAVVPFRDDLKGPDALWQTTVSGHDVSEIHAYLLK